jgi:hypothetical protein
MIQYEVETINLVMQYLASKPYAEVYQLIELLNNGKMEEEEPND